ncbi:hypothetical protein [Marinobacter alkaliphilus]|uniref:S-type pyocin n=1 Tax=Marinobacter alkaliphilus TaxID=254719 RepID=A0ABZ3E608_9GAMM
MSEAQVFTVETSYRLHYSTKYPVPIPDIIESLKNVEKLLERSPKFIEKAFKDLEVVRVQVYVDSLKSGSLTEEFLVKYVFKGRENHEKAKEVVAKMLEDNTMIRTVVAVGIGAMITYGVMSSAQPGQPTSQFEAYQNTIINIGGTASLDAEDIAAVLEATTDKKQLAKQAIAVVRPAKADPDGTIEMDNIPELTIPKEYVQRVPSEYEAPIPQEKTAKYQNVPIFIYASDRDRTDTNWAGAVPGIADSRVRFRLSEGIDPKELHGRTQASADVTVIERYVPSKKIYEVKIVEIDNVYPPKPASRSAGPN